MTNCMSTVFVLAFLFFVLGETHLLPIVDDQERNSTQGQIQTYIVHVLKPNTTAFLDAQELEDWYTSFLPSTHLDSGEPRLIYSYNHAITGFAARLTPDEATTMESIPGFLLATPDRELETYTTYTPAFLGLNQWQGLWWNSTSGVGTIVGVIDTGILPSHPSFSDAGMPPPPRRWRGRCDFAPALCNNKLIGARAFKAGHFPSPLDDNGHGTHTAGTAAGGVVYGAQVLGQGTGTAVGVAPNAHLAVYKVLFNNRGYDSDLIAAIDQAIADGVDVLSMSLGLVSQNFVNSGVIMGSFAAMQHGIIPCAAAGNSGPYKSVIANDAPWILTVGASTTDRRIRATVRLGNGMELDGESAYQPSSFGDLLLPIVYPGSNGIQSFQFCDQETMLQTDVRGKIVVCWTGEISDVKKGKMVKQAGGAAMIVMNGPLQSGTTPAEAHVLPVAHVSYHDAEKIISYIATSLTPTPTATIVFKGTQFGIRPSPAVASFSSRGPSIKNGGILKPDIVGPGVNILAAWPYEVGPSTTSSTSTSTFNFLSGTSMATPHLSGIAAMLKSIHPQWSPAAIKSAIMTTAVEELNGEPITDEYPANNPISSFFAMGAGHVYPMRASDPGLVYDLGVDDYISYLCGSGFNDVAVSIIAGRRIHCSAVSMIGAEQLNYPSISLSLESRSRKRIIRTVTNVGEAHEVYRVRVTEPKGVEVIPSSYRLSFTRVGEMKTFRLLFRSNGTHPGYGLVSEGQLLLVSNKHEVRSPISVTFI